MIYSLLESSMRCAIEREENINEDGSINWNFVDADAYCNFRPNPMRKINCDGLERG